MSVFVRDAIDYLKEKHRIYPRQAYFLITMGWISGVMKSENIPMARYSHLTLRAKSNSVSQRLAVKKMVTSYCKYLEKRKFIENVIEKKISFYKLTDKGKGYLNELNELVGETVVTYEKNFEDYAGFCS